jgi:hypothetical protein
MEEAPMQILVMFAFLMMLAALATCIPIAARTAARGETVPPIVDLELQQPAYGTAKADTKVLWMENYRRARGVYLRRKGRTLLANREYQPLLHKGRA